MGFFSVSRGLAGGPEYTGQDQPILSHLNLQEKLYLVTFPPVTMGATTTEPDV